MHIIVDAHQDLAHNILSFGRDYTRSVLETRRLEIGTPIPERAGTALLGFPEAQQGNIALIFSTLFAAPKRYKSGAWDVNCYGDTEEAHRLYRTQMDVYRRLVNEHPDEVNLIRNAPDLNVHLAKWQRLEETRPIGLILLMEGADAIRSPEELEEWWALGLRIIGPAWMGTRYSGGWHEPGPLTNEGRELLAAMAEYGFILDLSHMDEEASLEALDRYEGALIASHSNAAALLPNAQTNRHLTDRVIRGIIERDGVIGTVLFNAFLKAGWSQTDGREEISLDHVIAQIDHICQISGDAQHVGIGSDFDGGFGLESVPSGIDTIADLQKLAPLLAERGYTESDIAAILGENFISFLMKNLPVL
ncbi:MAG: peptidase M19 [Anaerolineae bacterium]|jgi:membrane dipeptidase|nr:peptidase M19 [Anaerolineae bacterium]MBT7069696.1 peptidase M19 [Anaerolineae bacterium]MBT7323636.1 peptidase M19 [Anaerolineae bacterium]